MALELNPSTDLKIKCLYKRSSAYYDSQQYEACNLDLTALLVEDPTNVHARVLMARALKMSQELKRAEDNISNAILMDAEHPLWYSGTF